MSFYSMFLPWLLLCGLVSPWLSHGQRSVTLEHPEGQWETLQRCRLNTNSVVDGDSFRVFHKGREYGFQLFFVDAPETEAALAERILEQALYFKIATNEVLRAGRMAARFIRERLTGRDLTVHTRWQNALGRGAVARFYCEILVDGKNLGELLIANGLARIHGQQTVRLDGARGDQVIEMLRKLEIDARNRHQGIWDDAEFAKNRGLNGKDGVVSRNDQDTSGARVKELLDVNAATLEDLMELPGVGRTLARRIIEQRPFKAVSDLNRVEGIGEKKLEMLKPLVRVKRVR